VTLATGREPENQLELVESLQDWHDNHLAEMPKNKELIALMKIAYSAVKSLKGEIMPLSCITNMLMREHN